MKRQSEFAFWRTSASLFSGSLLAHVIPFMLGPLLTRLYAPEAFGHYALFAAVAANVAVLSCARYDFALPLARTEEDVSRLMALCAWILLCVVGVSALCVTAAVVSFSVSPYWLLLPLAVAASGAIQWFTMWATRAQRFNAISAARLTMYGGGAILQAGAGAGALTGGVFGLVAGQLVAATAALCWFRKPPPPGGWAALSSVSVAELGRTAARFHRFPLLNGPHAFAGALQDTLTIAVLVALTGDAAAGYWGLVLRYLKAPATLIGGAISQTLYPRLINASVPEALKAISSVIRVTGLMAAALALVLFLYGPSMFALVFGAQWHEAGELARALAPYVAMHFVASPLSVVTLACDRQDWALRVALLGQLGFMTALILGVHLNGLIAGAWAVSGVMTIYFAWFVWRLPVEFRSANRREGKHES